MACPNCGSNNITSNSKGYGIGKGIIGATLFGPLGLVAGNIGRNDIICTCLDCGYSWNLKNQIQHEQRTNYQNEQEDISAEEFAKISAWMFTILAILVLYGGFVRANIWMVITSLVFLPLIFPITSTLISNKIPSDYQTLKKIVTWILGILLIVSICSPDNDKATNANTTYNQEIKQPTIAKQEDVNIPFKDELTAEQIDKICKNSLAEVNANSVSNYIKVSSNPSAKKYVYQSKETLYKYSCGFTGNDTFYINGEGWENIIPRGTLYKGKTPNCINFDLYDPGFKITHNFTVCD